MPKNGTNKRRKRPGCVIAAGPLFLYNLIRKEGVEMESYDLGDILLLLLDDDLFPIEENENVEILQP